MMPFIEVSEGKKMPAHFTLFLDVDISCLSLRDKDFCEENAALCRRDDAFWEVIIYIGTDDDREYFDSLCNRLNKNSCSQDLMTLLMFARENRIEWLMFHD